MNVTRTLIITDKDLLRMTNLPKDLRIISGGPTSGSKVGEFGGIYAEISSKEFKSEDSGKPIELKES